MFNRQGYARDSSEQRAENKRLSDRIYELERQVKELEMRNEYLRKRVDKLNDRMWY